MAGDRERVRVVLERSGGLLGRPVRRGLDTAHLPAPEAARLRELVRTALREGNDHHPGGAPAGAASRSPAVDGTDRFVYHLDVDAAGTRTVRTIAEPVPPALRPLLDLLRDAPRLPPPGPRPA
jgi:hypothetical protein